MPAFELFVGGPRRSTSTSTSTSRSATSWVGPRGGLWARAARGDLHA